MHPKDSGIVLIDDQIVPLEQATLPIDDRGFLFGHAVFETMLILGGHLTNWPLHFERLQKSCQDAFLSCPSQEDLLAKIHKLQKENAQKNKNQTERASLRLIITGGSGIDFPIRKEQGHLPCSRVIIICRNLSDQYQKWQDHGVSLWPCQDNRHHELVHIKSTNYLFPLISLEKAKQLGFDDVLFFSNDMYTESTTANFIWVDQNGCVCAAPFDQQTLAGTTLTALIQILSRKQISFAWKALPLSQSPAHIQCAGILSSLRGIVPVTRIDQMHLDLVKAKATFDSMNAWLKEEWKKQ